ncbi:hypothetical protein JCM6882_003846 [Rhodosporidiobolus microsporus]
MLPPRRLQDPHAPTNQPNPDAAVRSTDSDALLSRASAHSLGYLSDPYSLLFLSPAQRRSPEKRPPLINIGTHARTWAVDELVEQFLSRVAGAAGGGQVQVLSLGAGTDTRFWRMRKRWEEEKEKVGEWRCRRWVEVDFAEATGAKARVVSSKQDLKGALGGAVKIEQGGLGLSSPLYALLPGDLRSLSSLTASLLSPPPSSSPSEPAEPLLDPFLPTLLLLECVTIYLNPEVTDAVLSWFTSTFGGARGSAVVSYDPFGLEDQFGAVMKRNLAARNLSLPGASSTPTLSSLTERLERNGVKGECGALSVKEIREGVVPADERERVTKIEQIDEVEELNLVLSHYAVAWGNVSAAEGGTGEGIGLQKRS